MGSKNKKHPRGSTWCHNTPLGHHTDRGVQQPRGVLWPEYCLWIVSYINSLLQDQPALFGSICTSSIPELSPTCLATRPQGNGCVFPVLLIALIGCGCPRWLSGFSGSPIPPHTWEPPPPPPPRGSTNTHYPQLPPTHLPRPRDLTHTVMWPPQGHVTPSRAHTYPPPYPPPKDTPFCPHPLKPILIFLTAVNKSRPVSHILVFSRRASPLATSHNSSWWGLTWQTLYVSTNTMVTSHSLWMNRTVCSIMFQQIFLTLVPTGKGPVINYREGVATKWVSRRPKTFCDLTGVT